MSRKRAFAWLTGMALVVCVLLVNDWLLWQPGLTEDNVRRIHPCATLAEADALLGGPATETVEMSADFQAYRWQRTCREGADSVVGQFFADGRVTAAGGGRRRTGPVACLRAWMGW